MSEREIELRIVANRLREALYNIVYISDHWGPEVEAAESLLLEFPLCIHCGHMRVGHDALHEFTPPEP